MHVRSHHIVGAVVCLALAPAVSLSAQEEARAGGTLMVTTSSEDARAAFWAGLDDLENIYFERGGRQMLRALGADPKLGIARAAYGLFAPGLTAAQRDQELNQGVADAASTSTGELLLAMAWRARTADRAAERRTLIKAAAALLPEDRHLAYYAANAEPNIQERVRQLEAVARRFPDYAPPLNQIAYAKNTLGDVPGGLAAAEQQVKVAPKNPNPHDSYAELLQFAGRWDEAATHYQHAMALDGDYIAAHTGLAEVAMLKGDGATARTHYGHAIAKDQVPQNRLNFRQAVAVTYVNEGNLKAAVAEFAAVAQEAESNNFPGVAAAAHRNLAVLEAALGDKNAPHGHLAKAQEIGGDVPAQQAFAAATHALLGHMAPAKAAAARLAEGGAAPNPTPALMRNINAVNGVVAAAEGSSATALEASQQAGPLGALAKVLAAEAMKKEGKRAEAQTLRDEVMAYSQVDLLTVIAKQRAKKV